MLVSSLLNDNYDRIDLNYGSDVNKSKESRKCIVCHYYFFNN